MAAESYIEFKQKIIVELFGIHHKHLMVRKHHHPHQNECTALNSLWSFQPYPEALLLHLEIKPPASPP